MRLGAKCKLCNLEGVFEMAFVELTSCTWVIGRLHPVATAPGSEFVDPHQFVRATRSLRARRLRSPYSR